MLRKMSMIELNETLTRLNSEDIYPARYNDERDVICHIIVDWADNGKIEFTEEEVQEAYMNLILDNVLESMSKDGILQTSIDENGEFLFELTDDGKKLAEKMFGK